MPSVSFSDWDPAEVTPVSLVCDLQRDRFQWIENLEDEDFRTLTPEQLFWFHGWYV